MPVSSRSTAWKIRRPLRVGITPFEITVPITVPCMPGSSDLIGATVLASSYRCGTWNNRSPAVMMPSRRSASARIGPTPLR